MSAALIMKLALAGSKTVSKTLNLVGAQHVNQQNRAPTRRVQRNARMLRHVAVRPFMQVWVNAAIVRGGY